MNRAAARLPRQLPRKIVLVNRVAEKACMMEELLGYLGHETYKSETAIPKITDKLMRRIIEWCEHGQNNGFDTMDWSKPVMEWTDDFSSVNWDTVLKIIGAANYPDISSRLRAGHATVAQRITGKTPKQICATFEFAKDLLSNLDASVPQSEVDWWTINLLSPPGTYWPTPSPTDVYRIRHLLQYVPLSSGHTVPAEIAHQIVSLACKPRLVERRRQEKEHLESSDLNILASSGGAEGDIHEVLAMHLCTQSIPYPSSEAEIPRMVPVRAIVTVLVRNDTWDDTSECHPWVEVSILRPLVPGLEEKSEALEDVVGGRWMDERDAKTALMERGWELVESGDGWLSWEICEIGDV
ncbi:Sulfur metabolism negative regulator [Lasiodiplodia theobromae]|uniref:Sulfur metabolism negative regulator n=1 Tax=Lasiodiplodia theobromae TaxID=45133 RepID=UPI0015C3E006|nr:Sulfur metabolism negative regulator [Lasiodiplodia theobromae]KAF4539235.1 Sulfur metabolism negative regulator [Lasiodiplodia theobromae]